MGGHELQQPRTELAQFVKVLPTFLAAEVGVGITLEIVG